MAKQWVPDEEDYDWLNGIDPLSPMDAAKDEEPDWSWLAPAPLNEPAYPDNSTYAEQKWLDDRSADMGDIDSRAGWEYSTQGSQPQTAEDPYANPAGPAYYGPGVAQYDYFGELAKYNEWWKANGPLSPIEGGTPETWNSGRQAPRYPGYAYNTELDAARRYFGQEPGYGVVMEENPMRWTQHVGVKTYPSNTAGRSGGYSGYGGYGGGGGGGGKPMQQFQDWYYGMLNWRI